MTRKQFWRVIDWTLAGLMVLFAANHVGHLAAAETAEQWNEAVYYLLRTVGDLVVIWILIRPYKNLSGVTINFEKDRTHIR